jgi:NifU-like protein involved in Fe-S cluster formation
MEKNKSISTFKNLLELVGKSHSFKHRGRVIHSDLTLLGVNESCGDKIILQLKLKNQKVQQALFDGESCGLSALGAETMCSLLEREKSIKPIGEKVFFKSLNFNFSPGRKKCAYLIWNTWENYVSQKQTKNKRVAGKK